MKPPHNFPRWLLTPLLVLNLADFALELGLAWLSRQKTLVYVVAILIAVAISFLANSEAIHRAARTQALPPPPSFERAKQSFTLNRSQALSLYSNLKSFVSSNNYPSQLTVLTANLANWLELSVEAEDLTKQAQLSDQLVGCYAEILEANGTLQMKCEN